MTMSDTSTDKRKKRNKRYYENKKAADKTIKADRLVRNNFIDFELMPEAKALATKIMTDYKDTPDLLHSLMEYLEVQYHEWYQSEQKRLKKNAETSLTVL